MVHSAEVDMTSHLTETWYIQAAETCLTIVDKVGSLMDEHEVWHSSNVPFLSLKQLHSPDCNNISRYNLTAEDIIKKKNSITRESKQHTSIAEIAASLHINAISAPVQPSVR